jgi:magnesium transporter
MPKHKRISLKIQEVEIGNPRTREKVIWTNIANAGKPELEYLAKQKKKYGIYFSELRASSEKSNAQRPSITKKEKHFFLIMHFPIFKDGEIVAAEIDFFIGHGLLITVHSNNIPALNNFFNTCKKDDYSLLSYHKESSIILLYELLSKLTAASYDIMDQNSAKITFWEKKIFVSDQRKAALEILNLKKNIISFRRIIQNHKNILKQVMDMKSSLIPHNELIQYYSELIEDTKRIWEFSEIQKESVDALNDTNESLLNYSINNVMKILTVVSAVFSLLMLLSSLFGMNIVNGMPFANNPNGFWLLTAIFTVIGLVMTAFFIKKRWI